MSNIQKQVVISPITLWNEAIENRSDSGALRDILLKHPPSVAEIVVEPGCSHSCAHCIYHPEWAKNNRSLSVESWSKIIDRLVLDFGIKRIMFAGRGLSRRILEIGAYIKKIYPQVYTGLIMDAPGFNESFLNPLIEAKFDQIDISLDGLEIEHDSQRRLPGSFKKTLDLLRRFKALAIQGKLTKHICTITCATTINIGSIPELAKLLNREGYPNILVTPVTILDGLPDSRLKLSDNQTIGLIRHLKRVAKEENGINIIFSVFDFKLVDTIRKALPDMVWNNELDDFGIVMQSKESGKIKFSYYPESISPSRELIINSDASILTTKVAASRCIPENRKFGTIMHLPGDIKNDFDLAGFIASHHSFGFYTELFEQEKQYLQRIVL